MNARRLWPALLVALAIAVQFRAVLVGRVYWFEDISAYFQPLYTAASRAMRRGFLPSWELGAWSGQPLLGDPQLGGLYPLNWLWLIVRPVRLYAWLTLAHVAIGAGGMWRLACARGRSPAAAALAALSFGLGAFMVLEVRHAMFVASAAWLPWILVGVERTVAQPRARHVVEAAAATAFALYAGGWSMLLYGALVVVAYAAARLVAAPVRRAPLAALAATAALGAALAAAQLLPAASHAALSPRALGLEYSEAASYAWPSWRYLVTLLVPTWYGSGDAYRGAPDQWELCGYAVGAVTTLLVLPSLLVRDRRGERLALAALCVLGVVLARGEGGGLHPLLYRHLPPFSSLRCPARALFMWSIAVPILGADGLDALVARLRPRARPFAEAALVGALALELLITWRAANPSTTVAEAEARPAAADWLARHARPGRIAVDVHLPQRFHNSGLLWGVESAIGYSSLPLWRYLHFLWIANHGAVYPHRRIAGDLSAQGLWRFTSPIVDLLSVEWVVAPRDRPVDAPGFTRAFVGPDGIDVWLNREAAPRAFVVYRAVQAASDEDAAQKVADPAWQPAAVAVVERPLDGVPAPLPGETPPRATPIRALVREGPTDLTVEAVALAPGVLVVGGPFHPGWRARVDGQPAELLHVDYALQGVALTPGTHVVRLDHVDEPLRAGGAVSLAALGVALALLRRERRRA
jgi:hypothetical protein